MVIEIKYDLKGSILDIGGGGEAVVGQIYGDRVTAIDNRQEELDEAPDCCTKLLMDAEKLLFSDKSFDKKPWCECFLRMQLFGNQTAGGIGIDC